MSADQGPTRSSAGQVCAIPGCHVAILPGRLMCSPHWFKLPHRMRVRVNMAYAVDRGSAEHRAAIAEAIQAVQAREAERAKPATEEG